MNILTHIILAILLSVNAFAYTPPVGIPNAWIDPAITAPSRPDPWATEQAGYYYVNWSTGIDSGRTYGTPTAPRQTIPNPIPEGSYVEVASTYSYGGSTQYVQGNGSPGSPVWIVGASGTTPTFTGNVYFYGTYLYISNLNFTGSANIRGNDYTANHIMIRDSVIDSNDRTATGIVGTASTPISNIIFYNNTYPSNSANWNDGSGLDTDYHGIAPSNYVNNVWIVKNTFTEISGNAAQIGGANSTVDGANHIYFGDNTVTKTRQSSVGIKKSSDVIISSNTLSDTRETYNGTGSNYCAGVSYQYAPQRLWILNNRIYDADHGIKSGGSTPPVGDYVYIIGNVIYNIHNPDLVDINGGWATGSAMRVLGIQHAYVVNNTIFDADVGIATPQQNMNLYLENNIISEIDYNHITYDSASTATTPYGDMRNGIVYQNVGDEVIRIASTTYTLATYPYGSGNSASDPLFTSTAGSDFTVQNGSPAQDTGLSPSALSVDVYDTFYTTYGLTITEDIAGTARPQNSLWDIGAYEYDEGYTPPAPTCSDLIQNGDETGVDCGGSCPACEQEPTTQAAGIFINNLKLYRWPQN